MNEEWKEITGFDRYSVSSMGRIRRNARAGVREMQMKLVAGNRGYLVIGLRRTGVTENFYVHRFVAAAFLGECPAGLCVNHKDGKKHNNAVDNLEYVTHAENMRHAFRTGLKKGAGIYPKTRACAVCGENFSPHRNHRGRDKTCSGECRVKLIKKSQRVTFDKRGLATHCRHGHSWSVHGFYINSKGVRVCRECNKASSARYLARKARSA
jgi:hypothetical protein